MKSPANIFRKMSAIRLLGILGVMTILTGCGNNCAQFECLNGECDKGACICDEGYEGTQCNQPWSNKFSGDYSGMDCYDVENKRYTITSLGPDSMEFDNFFGANIISSNQFVVPEQVIQQEGQTFTVKGDGSYSNDTVMVNYTSDYDDFVTQCNLVIVKDN